MTFSKRIYAVASLFLFLGAAACGNSSKSIEIIGSGTVQKINITRDQVYDLSGYASAGGGNPFNLFDENAFVDPRYDHYPDGFIPVTNCQPTDHPAIYFHGSAGSRIVVDLNSGYQLKEIYLYDRSHTADSFWIYTGNLKKWKKVATMTTVSQTGFWGWKKISLDEQTRFVMIQFSSYESAITEMVLYGIPSEPIPPSPKKIMHKGFTQTSLDHFLGVNYIMETKPQYLKPFHYSRLYNFALDYDNEPAPSGKPVPFNMIHYGYFNNQTRRYVYDIDTLQHFNEGNIWYSIRGVAKWMSDLGFTDKDRPLNKPGLETERAENYSRHGELMWTMAAFFGYEKVDTNLLSLSNAPRQSGRGSMHLYENGNEEDANWVGNKYCNPCEYYAQSSADWDGDEGRLGTRVGIRQADPQARLMTSGMIELDTNRVKTYRLLCENLRTDRQFIWQGGIQYHHYANRNRTGISPEADSMRWRLTQVADCSFRIAPGVKCFLGENGYDKNQASAQATPVIPGFSIPQSQGIMILRSINATFFSGFDAYILYWLRDGLPQDDARTYLSSGLLGSLPDGSTQVYPAWYYISTLVNRLGKYRPDAVVQEKEDVWIYRYRNTGTPDSVAYFIYKPSVNGSRVNGYAVELGKLDGNRVKKINFLDQTEQGSEEMMPVSDGRIRITVEEKPMVLLCKELPAGK